MNKLQDEIARIAYELYEKRGRGHGCHLDDWLEAERIVLSRHVKTSEASTKSPKAKKLKAPSPSQKAKVAELEGKTSRGKRSTGKKDASKKTV